MVNETFERDELSTSQKQRILTMLEKYGKDKFLLKIGDHAMTKNTKTHKNHGITVTWCEKYGLGVPGSLTTCVNLKQLVKTILRFEEKILIENHKKITVSAT